jgi:putative transposase
MMPEEFHAWSQRVPFSKETEALIAAIRSSPPVRRVTRRAKNVTGRYHSPTQQTGIGQWRCPPGQAFAEQLGLSYRLRSSVEYHPLEILSLKFLQDFRAHDVLPNPEQEALAHIQAHPGIPLSELLATYPDLPVDVLWTLLATHRVFTDLSATLLMRHDQVTLYAEETQVRARHSARHLFFIVRRRRDE